ncbi:two component transcriptional regulator, LuxR family [Agreia bicolorata]|uniref:LuxR family transcriptional regulator n=1 Tax=Agreia bicolorata TaxID=110935 RepID=A0A1T4Y9F2_9MICO|nr:response regulator transcription factor [Agreia bicolorata]KJC64805.1 LuxR family transcriptional regulator [Agreia bicolorata]SKA97911.1 two component transcriptional regulator, LuxR family [Agreia bicolorata]
MTDTEIRVLLVDDQDLLRSGIRIILESEPGIVVVGEARDGHSALERIRQVSPDVVCLDVQMPGMDGLTATRLITALEHPPAVLVLTTFDRDDYLFAALEGGASGFLLKNSTPEQLVDAVQIVARGDALLSPDVTRRVIERFTQGGGDWGSSIEGQGSDAAGSASEATRTAAAAKVAELTARESDVLGLVARGMSNAEIASQLFLGEATVKTHVSKVLQKLGVRDRIQAVVFAYEHGIAVPGA